MSHCIVLDVLSYYFLRAGGFTVMLLSEHTCFARSIVNSSSRNLHSRSSNKTSNKAALTNPIDQLKY